MSDDQPGCDQPGCDPPGGEPLREHAMSVQAMADQAIGNQAAIDDPIRLEAARRRRLINERRIHWRRTRIVTALLLLVWFVTGFGTVFYARELAHLTLFGWPMSFYLAAQGAALISLAIVGAYALLMRRLDRRFARAMQDPQERS